MKKFLGLLKREHVINGGFSYLVLALVVLAIIFIPIGLEQYNAQYRAEQVRFIVVTSGSFLIGLSSVLATVGSINRDLKIKKLWLHNTQSIYTLVGVKVVYQLLALIVIGLVNFLGLFFVGEMVEGTVRQFAVLALLYFYLLIAAFVFFVVFVIFINTVVKQMHALIGKLGYVIVFVAGVIFVSLGDQTPDLSFLKVGYVDLPALYKYLPTFNDSNMTINFLFDFYILEEIVTIGFVALFYVVACKWLERVITR